MFPSLLFCTADLKSTLKICMLVRLQRQKGQRWHFVTVGSYSYSEDPAEHTVFSSTIILDRLQVVAKIKTINSLLQKLSQILTSSSHTTCLSKTACSKYNKFLNDVRDL